MPWKPQPPMPRWPARRPAAPRSTWQSTRTPRVFRILTGDRPTGHLHLGHYFGTLRNRVLLQNRGVETWVLVADYQVITDRDGVGPIRERVLGLVADYLAAGIDPERSTIFNHSAVPALNQLMLPFLSLVTESELHRNPTVKAELEATEGRAMTGLMLTYPVHQAADILFCKANIVPVGQDQLPHLEQARLIAQRFDKRYGRATPERPVFPRPEALLSEVPLLLGTDGQKMSKSRGNTIELRMTADETAKILKKAKTDAERRITFDPEGRPEVSNLLMLASLATGEAPEAIADRIGDAAPACSSLSSPSRSTRCSLPCVSAAPSSSRTRTTCCPSCTPATSARTNRPIRPCPRSARPCRWSTDPTPFWRNLWHTTSSPSTPTTPSAHGCSPCSWSAFRWSVSSTC